MKAKVLTWNEFRECCYADACNWVNSGYSVDELTEDDIINEYPEDYFTDTTDTECDEFSSVFAPVEFAVETLKYITRMSE